MDEEASKINTTKTSSPDSEELGCNHSHDDQVQLDLSTLPKERGWVGPYGTLNLYQGFWYPSVILPNVIAFQNHFQAHDQDILLASKPKSGTTWLKALIFAIVNRNRYSLSESPLLASNPHELVPFIELELYAENQAPDLSNIPSPRLFATHVPYSSLPDSVKYSSNCPIVYVCRNPLDVVVSFWHYVARYDGGEESSTQVPTVEELLETYCRGVDGFGPHWDHLLGYWKESLENPRRVLFLKYEDMMADEISHVKKLAEFIGFPFSLEEQSGGVVQEICKLCSFGNLKDLGVNKNGKFIPGFENKCFFRKGEVGDWVNHFSSEMAEGLNKVIEEKLDGSGLTFKTCS